MELVLVYRAEARSTGKRSASLDLVAMCLQGTSTNYWEEECITRPCGNVSSEHKHDLLGRGVHHSTLWQCVFRAQAQSTGKRSASLDLVATCLHSTSTIYWEEECITRPCLTVSSGRKHNLLGRQVHHLTLWKHVLRAQARSTGKRSASLDLVAKCVHSASRICWEGIKTSAFVL